MDENTNEIYMPVSSTIVLKRKKMQYVPLVLENSLTTDALVDSSAYVNAIAQSEWDKNKQQALANIIEVDHLHDFFIQVEKGQLEKPIATATLKFDIADNIFAEHFVVMKNLTGPVIGFHCMRHNSVVIDTAHCLFHFLHPTMQAKNVASKASAKPQLVAIHNSNTITPMTTETITAFVEYPWEWQTTGIVTPVENITEAVSLLIFHSMSTIIDNNTTFRVTNTKESPYSIKKNTQIAESFVVTTEQSKFIKPVDTAILSTVPEGDTDLITYLTKLLRMNKPEQQNNTFLFPTAKKNWQNWGSRPNTDTNPQRTAWIETKKTEPRRWRRISNEISQAIWLDRHTAHRIW